MCVAIKHITQSLAPIRQVGVEIFHSAILATTQTPPRLNMRPALPVLLLVASLVAACGTKVTNPVSGKSERTVMDETSEVAEGKKGHAQVLAEYGAFDHPKLQAYVNALGQKLAAQSPRAQLQWHFTVLDSPEINAFALPGGYVYVTRGIMAYMDSEADLAGVIGHEIGHVTARHGAQRATRQQSAGIGVLAASVLGAVLEAKGIRGAGQAASDLSQNVAAGYIASYGRDQELQADKLGAEYLAKSRYNPHNMVDVIGVLKDQERFAADVAKNEGRGTPSGTTWLSSHPSNDQRLRDITAVAATYQGSWGDDGRARYLQAIEGITFGDGREQGVTRGRNFFHEPLGIAITAPLGFSVHNAADAITIVNASGDAALLVKLVPPDAGSTHEEIVKKVFKPTQGRAERLTINGLPATHFVGQHNNDKGQSQTFELTLVSGPANRPFALIYAGRDAAAVQRASAGLREAEFSFRPLSATDRTAARPWTLKTVALPAGGLAELARRSPLPNAEGHLRLINNVYSGGQLKPGQPVKVVE